MLGIQGIVAAGNNICTREAIDIIPNKNLGNESNCEGVGNPIHAGTGNKYAMESDYISSSLSFIRHYNSQQNKLDRNAGTQWRNTYSRQLKFSQSDTLFAAFAERQDGSTLFFTLENDLWIGDEDISAQLFELPDGNWQLITSDDATEYYDIDGKLLAIINRDGRTKTLTYDSDGRMIAVSDDVGRVLNFAYDGSNRIAAITDPADGLYQYAYDVDGNLTSVTYPDNKIRTYHYNEQAYTSGANLPNALTGITDENNVRYATYTYDTKGRAFITEHAGGADKYTLTYNT
ncbi:MAG: RHS repeat protein, partial [Nitrosomonas sp.]|nr:RHS repeat protein [Nitrosomonas sp.]